MKKKQLMTSLAVTGIVIGSMVGNAFADTTTTNTTTTDTAVANTTATNTTKVYTSKTNDTFVASTLRNNKLSRTVNYNHEIKEEKGPIVEKGYIKHIPRNIEVCCCDPIMDICIPGFYDDFLVYVNAAEGACVEDARYDLSARVSNVSNGRKRIDFRVITEKGTELGALENSQSLLDSKITYSDGCVEYNFHYSFLDMEEPRIININVFPQDQKEVQAQENVQ